NLKPNRPWAETGVDCFTSWTPNGMVEASYATKYITYRNYVKDAEKFGKDTMAPIMPGFNDDNWRPDPQIPSKTLVRAGGENWREQIRAAIQTKSEFLFIQAWNEWHEGSQIEPSAGYKDQFNNPDPYLYLRILAEELDKAWEIPSPPLPESIDSLRRQEVAKAHTLPKPTPLPPSDKVFEFLAHISFQHQIGKAEPDGWSARVGQDDPKKYLCYGPYTMDIPEGSHQALFRLMIDNNQADNNRVITLDVWDATNNKRLGKKDIRRKEFKTPLQYQDFEIKFQNIAGHPLEFRTFWHGGAWIKESKVTVSIA
ncbi:MAG: glycoside hydrolase family 99-like domain-containing protein, partial [Nitrospira sp.]|nr:glycoside hydrolase family 99-like domain-containing protein [Nitrospira sp.]